MWTFQRLYNRLIRHRLPRKIGVYNGVAVRNLRLFDQTDENWSHKSGMVRQLSKAINPGDHIVEIGSGMGVLTVRAAREATRNGAVYGYEAGDERADVARETIDLNDVGDWTTVAHAFVEGGDEVWGELGSPEDLSVKDLPDFDVLVTDCDGGERPILEALTAETMPKAVVIESHGMYGAPTEWVTNRLTELGLSIRDVRPESKKTPSDRDNMAILAMSESTKPTH